MPSATPWSRLTPRGVPADDVGAALDANPSGQRVSAHPYHVDVIEGEALGSSGLELRIPTDDAAVIRRVKAIAATRPLHDLDRNKTSYEGAWWDRYDLLSLGVAAIDQVALSMGISAGLSHDETLSYVANQARRQVADATADQYLKVAERVVSALLVAPLEVVYHVHEGGTTARRTHSFRLLYEQWAADETIDLRASEEAINVLVDALDLDVESAQIAAEAQMRVLVERGALDSAVQIARRARYQSVQYLERIRAITRDTVTNPDAFDWANEVPALLDAALNHVAARIEAEIELRNAVEEQRDAAYDPDVRRKASELVDILHDCQLRHTELQRHLLGARGQLRTGQDERFRRSVTAVQRSDLERDLILPMLGAPAQPVTAFADQVLARMSALATPFMVRISTLIDELLEPPAVNEDGEAVPEPEFDDTDVVLWWEPYWDAAESIVDGVTEATPLSDLLARARTSVANLVGPEGAPLDEAPLVAAVAHIAHERLTTAFAGVTGRHAGVYAFSSGTALDDPSVAADDLVVLPIVIDTTPGTDDFALVAAGPDEGATSW